MPAGKLCNFESAGDSGMAAGLEPDGAAGLSVRFGRIEPFRQACGDPGGQRRLRLLRVKSEFGARGCVHPCNSARGVIPDEGRARREQQIRERVATGAGFVWSSCQFLFLPRLHQCSTCLVCSAHRLCLCAPHMGDVRAECKRRKNEAVYVCGKLGQTVDFTKLCNAQEYVAMHHNCMYIRG